MDDICKEKHKQIDQRLDRKEKRLNDHSKRIDIIEQNVIAQQKDTLHLQDAIQALKKSIDNLISEIGELKTKPLKKYEQIVIFIITAIIGIVIGRAF